jgi:diguanylate cyclase (GGDEF)-like protein
MGSFRKRLLVLIIGLVVVTQTVTLAAVLVGTRRNVEARAAEQLRSGGTLAEHLIGYRAGQLANGVGVLAADFGFREAVASGDAPTIRSAVRNNARRIGADIVLLLDTRGRVLTSSLPVAPADASSLGSLLGEFLGETPDDRELPNFRVFGGRSYQFFVAPVHTPETIAWVAMGFVADDALAGRIRDLVGSEVAILTHGSDGLTHIASTFGGQGVPFANDVFPVRRDVPGVTRLAGADYLSFARRLDVRGDRVDLVLLKPLQDVLAPYRELRNNMLLIDTVALMVAALVGAVLGRSATRPIGELVRAARRIERGQYGTEVSVAGGEEFRSLAATFNTMQSNIAAREADISHQAYHDPITGLPNRAQATRDLEGLLADPTQPAALVLIGLSNLRDINTSLGHQVGEDVLREVARRLQQNAARDDIVARIGETQFLVISSGCSAERSLLYAEQLGAVIRSGFHLVGVSLDLRLVCGVCLFPSHGNRADELLQRVEVALDDADETHARVVMYQPGQDQEHRRRLTLVTDLRAAIDQDQLSLVYQPKVTMASRSVRSLEALVRWTHPQLGRVSPGEFVPLAESTGSSRALTNWVLGAAIRQMGEWRRQGLELELAVNLSAPDILDPDLSDAILGLLRRERVEPTALMLEITESAVMRDPQVAARNMQLLRIAGVRFSIDDFGTGHSSLSQLSVLPVDELKIDRSFIAQGGNSAVTIITSTIELGHSMGLKVVAEGVEDAPAWNLLRRLGCDFAQGYLISPPLPACEVPEYVRKANQLLPASDSTVMQIRALEVLAGRSSVG